VKHLPNLEERHRYFFTTINELIHRRKFFTKIEDVCDYACEKRCLYIGGVKGGTCTRNGRCHCLMKPSGTPPTTKNPYYKKQFKPPYFHFFLNLPAKWLKDFEGFTGYRRPIQHGQYQFNHYQPHHENKHT